MAWTSAQRAEVREHRRRLGFCVQCGLARAVPGGVLCERHREDERVRSAEARALSMPQGVALAGLRDARAALEEIRARPWSQANGVEHVHALRALEVAAGAVLAEFGIASMAAAPEGTSR